MKNLARYQLRQAQFDIFNLTLLNFSEVSENKYIMNASTIITLVLVIGIVWGGLIYFLSRAVKYEKLKSKNGKE